MEIEEVSSGDSRGVLSNGSTWNVGAMQHPRKVSCVLFVSILPCLADHVTDVEVGVCVIFEAPRYTVVRTTRPGE